MCPKDSASCKHLEAERTARQAKQREIAMAAEEAIAARDPAVAQSAAIAKAVAAALAGVKS